MPLFQVGEGKLVSIEQTNFSLEKELQTLVERNLGEVFNCRFVATEFSTGAEHAGRIDTLALSEENNPVIIEYKKVESSDLVNQSLFYLSWMEDHHGDFEIEVQRTLGSEVEVDWSDIRVLCIAPNFRKYDLHAVKMMGANIELWSYRLYGNSALYLEEVFRKAYPGSSGAAVGGKGSSGGASGGSDDSDRSWGQYTFEERLEGKPEEIRNLALEIQEFVLGLDPAMEETPRKNYIAYKISQNIVCMELQGQRILLFLKLDPKSTPGPSGISRDVSAIGHFGTGDLEVSIRTADDLEAVKPYIEMAYRRVGG